MTRYSKQPSPYLYGWYNTLFVYLIKLILVIEKITNNWIDSLYIGINKLKIEH